MRIRISLLIIAVIWMTACSFSPTPDTAVTTYTVRAGDTLAGVAERYYGDSIRWQVVYNANRDQLQSPMGLKVGMVLIIPPLAEQQ